MKISHTFVTFQRFRAFSHFFSKSRDSLSFPEHFSEIPAKIHQMSQKNDKNRNFIEKRLKKRNFIFIPAKIWTIFC